MSRNLKLSKILISFQIIFKLKIFYFLHGRNSGYGPEIPTEKNYLVLEFSNLRVLK